MSLISHIIFSFNFSCNVIEMMFKAVLARTAAQGLFNARLTVIAGSNQKCGIVLEQEIEQFRQIELDAGLD